MLKPHFFKSIWVVSFYSVVDMKREEMKRLKDTTRMEPEAGFDLNVNTTQKWRDFFFFLTKITCEHMRKELSCFTIDWHSWITRRFHFIKWERKNLKVPLAVAVGHRHTDNSQDFHPGNWGSSSIWCHYFLTKFGFIFQAVSENKTITTMIKATKLHILVAIDVFRSLSTLEDPSRIFRVPGWRGTSHLWLPEKISWLHL